MSEQKSYLDRFSDQEKPESFSQEKFIAVDEHTRRRKTLTITLVVVALIAGILAIILFTGLVRVPNLVGMTLDEANVWATQNRIILATKSAYNFDAAEGTVIAQDVAAGKTVRKNAALTIQVSLGADPDEKIAWPDVMTMKLTEIEAWIDQNKLTGVKIATANSDVVAADQVISYALTDDTEENFVRKSRATITVSLGPVTQSDTVVVSDFSSMKTAEILKWAANNGVAITLDEAFDDYVAAGNVVAQSVKASTEILKTEPITVTISKGKAISVPDFAPLLQDEANTWAKQNNVTLMVQQDYSSGVSQGKLISQSVAAGTTIAASDEITLVYSLGKIQLASFIGKTKLDILNWQADVNNKGGAISISFSEAYGEKGTAGRIIGQSIQNDYIAPGSKISVVISKGMKMLAPDFAGLNEAGCRALAQSAGIDILFNYQSSSSVPKGYVISQSPVKGIVITDADPVTINLSLTETAGSLVTVPDFTVMAKADADAWAHTNNMTLTYQETYSNSQAKGALFNPSAAAGSSLAQGSTITLGLSLGQVEMISLIGKTKLDLYSWLNTVNSKGGNISATFTYADNHAYQMNIILSQSILNTLVPTGTTINFEISWDPTAP
jgi:beta-lactam-binding protein with PASTA domain